MLMYPFVELTQKWGMTVFLEFDVSRFFYQLQGRSEQRFVVEDIPNLNHNPRLPFVFEQLLHFPGVEISIPIEKNVLAQFY